MAKSRSPVSAERTRELLLDAALEVMGQRGISRASTRAITEQAGVPQGMFHYCFSSKNELFRALLQRELREGLALFEGMAASGKSLGELLDVVLRAQIDQESAALDSTRTMLEVTLHCLSDPALADLAPWERDQYLSTIQTELDTLARRGVAFPTGQRAVAEAIYALSTGLSFSHLTGASVAELHQAASAGAKALGTLAVEPEAH